MAERTVPQLFTQIKKFGAEGLFNKALPLVQEGNLTHTDTANI